MQIDTMSLIIGFLVGAGIVFILKKSKNTDINIQDFNKYKNDSIGLRSRLNDCEHRLEKSDTENKNNIALVAAANEKILSFAEMSENMKKEFKEISLNLFELQKESVSAVQTKTINPVREQMEKMKEGFDKQIKDMLKDGAENKTSLIEQLNFLRESTGTLQKGASDLANALKNKKTQGNWGEFQLEKIFEILGFTLGREYNKEVFVKDENGSVRPDYVLNLPNNRRVIIDSKLSLESYIKYANSDNDTDKKIFIKEFVAATKKHIDTLGSKEYQNKLKNSQLDYVFMFMPLEHSYLLALEEDPNLYEYSFKHNVAITTPSLLFPMMRTIDTILKIDKRDKNIEEVIGMINSLYEKYIGFTENFLKIGNQINTAKNSYDTAAGQLSTGSGNMSSWFDKIQKKSGIQSNKKIAIAFEKEDAEYQQEEV